MAILTDEEKRSILFKAQAMAGTGKEKKWNLQELGAALRIIEKTLGKLLGVTDTFSNFRAVRKEIVPNFTLKASETFGAEFQIIAKKKGLTIGELKYDSTPRRKNPRIGGPIEANLRIIWALLKSLIIYLV
jgi:dolichol-phosphate mannosyltransferase